jgi:RND family efflux transporter MFP subunit
MLKKSLSIALALIVALGLIIGVVKLRQIRTAKFDALPQAARPPWALHLASVQQDTLTRSFPVLAKLIGSTEITVSSQVSGIIKKMGPREGIKVKKGQLLAQIDVRDLIEQRAGLVAQRKAADAEVKRTQNEYERRRKLTAKGLTSKELLESKRTAAFAAQEQVKSLTQQIATLDVRIGYGKIYAPQTALIAARLTEPGEVAQLGKPLYRLTVESGARMQVKLPQTILEKVHKGTTVLLKHGEQQASIHINRVFPVLDTHALGTAEADLPAMSFHLPSGARISAKVVLEQIKNALIVPRQSVIKTAQGGFLFKAVQTPNKKWHLKRIPVTIRLDASNHLAVATNALQAGDQVVIAHHSMLLHLKDGDPLYIEAEEEEEPLS